MLGSGYVSRVCFGGCFGGMFRVCFYFTCNFGGMLRGMFRGYVSGYVTGYVSRVCNPSAILKPEPPKIKTQTHMYIYIYMCVCVCVHDRNLATVAETADIPNVATLSVASLTGFHREGRVACTLEMIQRSPGEVQGSNTRQQLAGLRQKVRLRCRQESSHGMNCMVS